MRSLSFNQGFPLERNLIKGMLQFTTTGETTSNEAVGAYLGINPYKVSGLRGWFCKLGLGRTSAKQYTLSPFGDLVRSYDPDMDRPGTLWLMHYFLTSEHDERSEVWYRCFNEFLQPEMLFSRDELQGYIERSLTEGSSNKAGIEKDTKELVKLYRDETALGSLSLITQERNKKLVARLSALPELLIVAYVLFDMWHRRYKDTNTIRLSHLVTEPETLGRIFVATSSQVREFILHLQAQGLVTYADTQHEPVTRLFQNDPIVLLKQYYQHP